MKNIFKPLILFLSLIFLIEGCSRTQEAFLSIQICLIDQQGVVKFLDIMQEVAKAENLTFIDSSAKTAAELKMIDPNKDAKRDLFRIIHVGIEGSGGMGVTAGNLGLPAYQIALGFTEGDDAVKAHQLSKRLVATLSQYWLIETVPAGQGALPLKACGG